MAAELCKKVANLQGFFSCVFRLYLRQYSIRGSLDQAFPVHLLLLAYWRLVESAENLKCFKEILVELFPPKNIVNILKPF
jgi:hypothetical protein